MIEIKNLNVSFQNPKGIIHVIKDLTIDIKEKNITAILGETGSGKSVLASAILGILPPYAEISGKIFISGTPVEKCRMQQDFYGKLFGCIPQSPSEALSPTHKIKTQFQHTISSPDSTNIAIRLLANFGFEHPEKILEMYPGELSGGMLQRILAALTISTKPKWLIADEPTKGLDPDSLEDTYEIFQDLYNLYQTGMILITHDLLFAKKIAHQIAILYDGNVVELGENILENPLHPYSQGFLKSLPEFGFQIMEGMAPGSFEKSSGCGFLPRCKYATQKCQFSPPMVEIQGRKVRCHLYG